MDSIHQGTNLCKAFTIEYRVLWLLTRVLWLLTFTTAGSDSHATKRYVLQCPSVGRPSLDSGSLLEHTRVESVVDANQDHGRVRFDITQKWNQSICILP